MQSVVRTASIMFNEVFKMEEKIFYVEAVNEMCINCYHIKAKDINDAKSKVFNYHLKMKEQPSVINIEQILLTKM